MKKMKKLIILLILGITIQSCQKEFEFHNDTTENAAFHAPEAYPGIILGMTKTFTTNSLYRIIHGPGLTAREFANMSTYTTEPDLVTGGPQLTGDNASFSSMWSSLHRSRGIAEKILTYIDDVEFHDADKVAAYKAYAKFFKAMTTGYMAQYWEKVTLKNDPDNKAEFVSRTNALNEAIRLLDEAKSELTAHPGASSIIDNLVSFEFSFENVINAFKARYEIELGNYQEAYNAADAVDLTARSVWSYDGGSIKNPIYANMVDPGATLHILPIDSLGLQGTKIPELGDMRNDFYLDYVPLLNSDGDIPVDKVEGFGRLEADPIPVYLPGEMLLIKAEAKARMGGANLADAVVLLNEVRTKTTDVFNVNAGLAAWTGNATDQTAVLDEIYKNYAIELFMQGQRWPIHRRFYPNYLDNVDWTNMSLRKGLERKNNFYPYPDSERANNPNCPADPAY